ncbi:MAG: hypothetical protein A2494_01275 [Candidatus Lloydbacteria bacterium RIFOXYC12_FULL_46_25]|uniref:GlxA-like beta barrel domain-containing protein n=1 Tax=Candidatus Lloydbacteria bacterium RIFOXYC12_FULL_46_25 TaxID=1798670 RepID=A0A1G2E1E0_9BACT|nr:MAG: hypothetical protein A2494_01275 [Candidatus Lloydbacteria bacterium RIFOXYC12_FULL_46_25]
MAKYLIQDIIPPEKKHRAAKKKAHATTPDDKEGIHNVVSHFGSSEDSVIPHEVVAEANQLMHSRPKEVIPENPRMILEEHIHNDSDDELVEQNGRSSTYTPMPPSNPTPIKAPTVVDNTPHFPEYSSSHRIFENNNGNKWLPWLVGASIIGILAIIILNFFGGATITIIPKHDAIPMDQEMTAFKNPQNNELPYAIMKVTLSETQEVPATGTKTVTEKASGQIIIFNQQTTAQRLIRNTRFESPKGKIYRINESINIPKATTKNGQVTPGSVTVTVYADEAGPDYNTEPTDFTVPGLKGTPQFDKVYARSKGAITGGASGTLKTVSDQDLKQAADELRIALETKLRMKARADLAPTQIGYDNGLVIELQDAILSSEKASGEDKALVSLEGTIYLVAFDRVELSKAIEKALIPTPTGETVAIKNIDALSFAMPTHKGEDLWKDEKITFSLKGTPELTWTVSEDIIIADLLGQAKEDFNEILAKYPTVESAKATSRPFWKSKFPEDPTKITIKIADGADGREAK